MSPPNQSIVYYSPSLTFPPIEGGRIEGEHLSFLGEKLKTPLPLWERVWVRGWVILGRILKDRPSIWIMHGEGQAGLHLDFLSHF
jgi:hypothetical protein